MAIAPNSIINGDCLEVMKDIDDRSIDCIIADLPYGVTNCAWDVVIPFESLWEQYKRIIKPNGAIALFGSQPFTSALVMSNPKWFKYEWIWDKNEGTDFLNAKNKPLRSHENICIFSGGTTANKSKNKMVYFPQMREGKPYTKIQRSENRKGTIEAGTRTPFTIGYECVYGSERYPVSIYKCKKSKGRSSIHPTQKPISIYEYLIKTYTQEGELILDNTAGSGTLAIAAINTNRQYICIEKDGHYFEVMRNRIENHDPNAPVKVKKPKAAPKGQLSLFTT